MTGRYPLRNGAWATTWGRSILGRGEYTMAELFRDNGYRTGMFGKWHLGDNYPYRPQDRGFETVVAHRGGGVGQTPDFWGNSYFDDTYFHNGEPIPHEGYCTDIWFSEAERFIAARRDEPFFCYISTNAPHSPYRVAEAYAASYRNNPNIPEPSFNGMITNIDDNFGKLRRRLQELDLEENTLLIFMTDNGSSGGAVLDAQQYVASGFNGGMRGKKGSYYEGGHRVPCFLRWPKKNILGGGDQDQLLSHIDLMPTLAELFSLDVPAHPAWDGRSFASLVTPSHGEKRTDSSERCIFLQYRQSTQAPEKWENGVMKGPWRLIAGTELYNVEKDPEQRTDVSKEHPDMVEELRNAHEAWWRQVSPGLDAYQAISIGSAHENPTRLDAFDLMGDSAWDQKHIREALRVCGSWNLQVEADGNYEILLSRWPRESELAQWDIPVDGGVELRFASASVAIQGQSFSMPIGNDGGPVFAVSLKKGPAVLEANFYDRSGASWAAYYVYVQRLNA